LRKVAFGLAGVLFFPASLLLLPLLLPRRLRWVAAGTALVAVGLLAVLAGRGALGAALGVGGALAFFAGLLGRARPQGGEDAAPEEGSVGPGPPPLPAGRAIFCGARVTEGGIEGYVVLPKRWKGPDPAIRSGIDGNGRPWARAEFPARQEKEEQGYFPGFALAGTVADAGPGKRKGV